jgi:hypothetical protein
MMLSFRADCKPVRTTWRKSPQNEDGGEPKSAAVRSQPEAAPGGSDIG